MEDPVAQAETIWRRKTDDEVLTAAQRLDEYTEEGRRIILSEAKRRGLNVAPLVEAATYIRGAPAKPGAAARCGYCDTPVLLGGRREGELRFCNDECRAKGILIAVSHRVPDSIVNERLYELHQGLCPRCGGPGPVDVHTSHRVWSAFVLTSSSNRPLIGCRSCGVAAKVKDSVFSLTFGWWGLPWRPIMTVVQVLRNLSGMSQRPDEPGPSAQLEKLVRLHLAAEIVAAPRDTT